MEQLHQLYIQPRPFIPEPSVAPVKPKVDRILPEEGTQPSVSFDALLDQTVATQDKLKFSAHAQDRARLRNIRLDERQMARLQGGVDKAAQKGAKEALVLVDNIAAVVSVNNKTVITMTDTAALRDNVFTNIDSAVIT